MILLLFEIVFLYLNDIFFLFIMKFDTLMISIEEKVQ